MLSNVCDWLYCLTKPFGEDAFSVRWYAQVRGHELVTRRDLLPNEPDHPRAEQRYYKLQLGKLVELPHPIPSRRLTHVSRLRRSGNKKARRMSPTGHTFTICLLIYAAP